MAKPYDTNASRKYLNDETQKIKKKNEKLEEEWVKCKMALENVKDMSDADLVVHKHEIEAKGKAMLAEYKLFTKTTLSEFISTKGK